MRALLTTVVLLATLITQGTAQLSCELQRKSVLIKIVSSFMPTTSCIKIAFLRYHIVLPLPLLFYPAHSHIYLLISPFLPQFLPLPFKHSVDPDFSINTTAISEGEQLVISLSAPILTRAFVPDFTGTIEVDITAEDLPADDERLRATFGKHHFNFVKPNTYTIYTV